MKTTKKPEPKATKKKPREPRKWTPGRVRAHAAKKKARSSLRSERRDPARSGAPAGGLKRKRAVRWISTTPGPLPAGWAAADKKLRAKREAEIAAAGVENERARREFAEKDRQLEIPGTQATTEPTKAGHRVRAAGELKSASLKGMRRPYIRFPPKLLEELDAFAAEKSTTRAGVVCRAVAAYLREHAES